MDNFEKVVCISTLVDFDDDYRNCMYSSGFDNNFLIVGELYNTRVNKHFNMYHNIFVSNGILKDKCICLIAKESFNKHFISLAEYRENRLKEVLNG